MFLKSLVISSNGDAIRTINFKNGLNLIVDETSKNNSKATGNGVGKTSLLKLIDFCLGAEGKIIYTDTEDNRKIYPEVKNFLTDREVLITLTLVTSLEDSKSSSIVIERNFLPRKSKIQRINGDTYTDHEFILELLRLLFPNQHSEKPTFRQIISHNVRYSDEAVNNTLKTLGGWGKTSEYESLMLFLLNCPFSDGKSKIDIQEKIRQENVFRLRLSKNETRTGYETALAQIEFEIEQINKRRAIFKYNPEFENDLMKFNLIKSEISRLGSKIARNSIRRNLILEAQADLKSRKSEIDVKQLSLIYDQAKSQIGNMSRSFEELVEYHNRMIVERISFISIELPQIQGQLQRDQALLSGLMSDEKILNGKLSTNETYEEHEADIIALGSHHQKKGQFEAIIQQLVSAEKNIERYTSDLRVIDEGLFSDEFETHLKGQLKKFNKHFAELSGQLYGETYGLKEDKKINAKGQRHYEFSTLETKNFSTGQKQGETSCFDLAYILFADDEQIPCLHFILNDKKELMHDNQLEKIAEFVNSQKLQLIVSILRDKLPPALDNDNNIVVKLSQEDKLLRIESYGKQKGN